MPRPIWFGLLSALTVLAASSNKGWDYVKEDPKTKQRLATLHAESWRPTSNAFVLKLTQVSGSIYLPASSSYSAVKLQSAFFDERSHALISGEKLTITNIP